MNRGIKVIGDLRGQGREIDLAAVHGGPGVAGQVQQVFDEGTHFVGGLLNSIFVRALG